MASAHAQFINEASQFQLGKKLSIMEMVGTIEVYPGERDLKIHEDVSLRSGGEIEEVNEKAEVEESIEQLKNEEESTFPKSEEKNEEVEIISEMTPWAYVQEELPSENIPYIFEVEEVIIPLIEYKGASILNIKITSFEEDVLKLRRKKS